MTTPTPIAKPTCTATKADGTACRAYAKPGGAFCFQHDPERAQAARAASVAGGIARNKPAPAEPIDLSTPELQRRAIEQTIDRVRAGQEPVGVARLVLYGISLARPIVELESIEARIAALEGRNTQ